MGKKPHPFWATDWARVGSGKDHLVALLQIASLSQARRIRTKSNENTHGFLKPIVGLRNWVNRVDLEHLLNQEKEGKIILKALLPKPVV